MFGTTKETKQFFISDAKFVTKTYQNRAVIAYEYFLQRYAEKNVGRNCLAGYDPKINFLQTF